MNTLLIFFALPIATILLSVVLQKVLDSPVLVAMTAFSVYLVVTFVINNIEFILGALVYTFLSFITAYLTRFIINYQNNRRIAEEELVKNACYRSCFKNK